MGEYSVEVRSESFYLQGEYNGYDDEQLEECRARGVEPELYTKRRHGIFVCENGETGQGNVEILLEDIPKVRASLDAVEARLKESRGQNLEQIVAEAQEKEEQERVKALASRQGESVAPDELTKCEF